METTAFHLADASVASSFDSPADGIFRKSYFKLNSHLNTSSQQSLGELSLI